MISRILVGTHGSDASIGALQVARALAERDGSAVRVLSVVEPLPVYEAGLGVPMELVELDRQVRADRVQDVRQQVNELGGAALNWEIEVTWGIPIRTIVRQAEEWHADLGVLGLGRHRPMDRVLGSETALHVIRAATVPVLAAPAAARGLPRSAVVAVDFSSFSRRAAGAALALLGSGATLHLLHVVPVLRVPSAAAGDWVAAYHKRLQDNLRELSRTLGAAVDVTVESHVRFGDPASEVVSFAEEYGAAFMAAGSHGRSFIGRGDGAPHPRDRRSRRRRDPHRAVR